MPDDRVSIDNLTTAPDLGSNDVLPVVHEVSGVKSTFKATLTAIGTFINKILNYSADLQTTNKTVIGAINELHNGGGGGGMSSDIIADTYDDTATYNTGDYCIYNDGLYVCDDDNVTGAWDSTKWTSIQVMSSIPTNATEIPIESGIATNTKDYIDTALSGKADISTPVQNLSCPRCPIQSFDNYKIQRIGNVIHFSVQLTFGNTSESGYAYFTSALIDSSDFVTGSFFDDIADVGYSIYKGLGTSLWIKNSNVGIAGADLKNKTRMFLNLIIFKAT